MSSTLVVTAVLAMASCGVDAAETYRNPIIDGNLADPVVIQHEGTYYLYATGQVDGDNGYRVYTSDDLVKWKRGPVVFRPGKPHVWAPDVWQDPDSGKFHLYYTANKTVGVADAEGPLGPFGVRRQLFDSAIDAHLFRDDDGRLYLYVVRLPGFRITVQKMASPTEPTGKPRVILQPESDWETRNGHVTEGPWMIKHNNRYYLIYSGSGANTPDYAVGYATSDSPLGPFTRGENNPIIQRSDSLFGPGHGCAIRDDDGQWWHVYHQKRTAEVEWGRFICLDRLWFDEQGRLHGRATRNTPQPVPAAEETLGNSGRSTATSPVSTGLPST
ncbi:MAG: glycoside hydrolase family 43 protein [Planctomycetota bacterium]